jgi:hypothetical protein
MGGHGGGGRTAGGLSSASSGGIAHGGSQPQHNSGARGVAGMANFNNPGKFVDLSRRFQYTNYPVNPPELPTVLSNENPFPPTGFPPNIATRGTPNYAEWFPYAGIEMPCCNNYPGPCVNTVIWKEKFKGLPSTFIATPKCDVAPKWARQYQADLNPQLYEKAIEIGKLPNYYEHFYNRQMLMQMISRDAWRPCSGLRKDPYTRAITDLSQIWCNEKATTGLPAYTCC